MSDDETLSSNDYLTSVLSMVNGYCKINLVVPQTSLFYSSDSLLPINAKVNDTTLNNNSLKNQVVNTPDSITNVFKNMNLKANENIDDKKLYSPDKTFVDEFQVYSKPSYSDNSNLLGKTEENKSEPKGKKKKNKYNKVSLSDSQTIVPSTHTDQNCSNEYFNQFESEALDDGHKKQEQELQNKQMKNIKNSISNNGHQSISRASPSHQNPENEITNENVSQQSQCPLCFGLYPTPDIEVTNYIFHRKLLIVY